MTAGEQKISENCVALPEPEPARSVLQQRPCALAMCMVNAAAMLELEAMDHAQLVTRDKAAHASIATADMGQAKLLRAGAKIAEELTAALILAEEELVRATDGDAYGDFETTFNRIRIAIANAAGGNHA